MGSRHASAQGLWETRISITFFSTSVNITFHRSFARLGSEPASVCRPLPPVYRNPLQRDRAMNALTVGCNAGPAPHTSALARPCYKNRVAERIVGEDEVRRRLETGARVRATAFCCGCCTPDALDRAHRAGLERVPRRADSPGPGRARACLGRHDQQLPVSVPSR